MVWLTIYNRVSEALFCLCNPDFFEQLKFKTIDHHLELDSG